MEANEIMHGKNPIRPPVGGDGSMLDVQHIFPTLQGEGPYAGWPAVFIRLGGCNLACDFCDTEFESFKTVKVDEVIKSVVALSSLDSANERIRNLVVITGGEPLRQPIEKLCEALIKAGFKVQIETNGTLYRALPAEVEIICSPKNVGQGYFPIREDLRARINAYKFIISAHKKEYSQVGKTDDGNIPIYVQPMDEHDADKNKVNIRLATQLAQANGYRLSLQVHKIIGIE